MLNAMREYSGGLSGGPAGSALPAIGGSLLLVALITLTLAAASFYFDAEHVTILYLIPVLFGAMRGGVVPAVISALAGLVVLVLFFYPPIYDFRSANPVNIVDLIIYMFVAVTTGQLAANLRRARMREEADTLREVLIGSVSHELGTPLSAIVGVASVLAESPKIAEDARLAPLVGGLREEADRLSDNIQNLLDATRISSAGIRPRSQWADPGDVISAAVRRKRRLTAGHRIDVLVAADLPFVEVDPVLIEKALGHVIENAIKYSPPCSSIEVRAQETPGMVTISVTDQGGGLSADERKRLWERFYRSPRHSGTTPGSGLGLWIARALVTASGGRVEAVSQGIGRGTTVSLQLPVSPRADSGEKGEQPND
jgi:K+-sensing histidine kinase KdpD